MGERSLSRLARGRTRARASWACATVCGVTRAEVRATATFESSASGVEQSRTKKSGASASRVFLFILQYIIEIDIGIRARSYSSRVCVNARGNQSLAR